MNPIDEIARRSSASDGKPHVRIAFYLASRTPATFRHNVSSLAHETSEFRRFSYDFAATGPCRLVYLVLYARCRLLIIQYAQSYFVRTFLCIKYKRRQRLSVNVPIVAVHKRSISN